MKKQDHKVFQSIAARLVNSKAHTGSHGFRGKQLVAWKTQRSALLVALTLLGGGKTLTREVRDSADSAACPVTVGSAKGTEAGKLWTSIAQGLLIWAE